MSINFFSLLSCFSVVFFCLRIAVSLLCCGITHEKQDCHLFAWKQQQKTKIANYLYSYIYSFITKKLQGKLTSLISNSLDFSQCTLHYKSTVSYVLQTVKQVIILLSDAMFCSHFSCLILIMLLNTYMLFPAISAFQMFFDLWVQL